MTFPFSFLLSKSFCSLQRYVHVGADGWYKWLLFVSWRIESFSLSLFQQWIFENLGLSKFKFFFFAFFNNTFFIYWLVSLYWYCYSFIALQDVAINIFLVKLGVLSLRQSTHFWVVLYAVQFSTIILQICICSVLITFLP